MKYFHYSLFFISLALPSALCIAGEKINQTINIENSEKLFIDVTRGIVKVTTWDKPEITIKGELDDTVTNLIFKNKGHKTLIKAKTSAGEHWGDSSILQVFVPKSTAIYFDGVDTTYDFNNIAAGISGETISGDVKVKSSHSKIYLSSMSGNIQVEDSSGKAQIKSVSGDIKIQGYFDKAAVKSMSGDISSTIDNINELLIKNVSGKINVAGQLKPEATVKLASVSGNIKYHAEGELNAECELATQFGGKIENTLTADTAKKSMMQKQELNFISGDGSGKLMISTISGAISLNEKSKKEL